jgi:hypothetical protein
VRNKSSICEYFEEMHKALSTNNKSYATRLLSEATHAVEQKKLIFDASPSFDPSKKWDVVLITAIKWASNKNGQNTPKWMDTPALAEPFYLVPNEVLDDKWKAEIRSNTPQELANKNIWIQEKDFAVS